MFVRHVFTFLSLCVVAILAKPLQMTTEGSASPPNHIDTLPVLNTSAENAIGIECNGALYGFNPNIADCEGAAQSINPDSDQLLWRERHTGVDNEVFPLPFAVFGDKGECFFKTVLQGPSSSAHASLLQVRRAAAALSLTCAAGGTSQGGIATNIGGDNNLAVILSTYSPTNVRCGRGQPFGDAPSCEGILADMPASTEKMLFGPEDTPGIQEPLPQLFSSSDERCLLRLFSSGRVDSASWYSIWLATEATFAICARQRKFGSFRGLGDHGSIFFTLASIGSIGNSSQIAIA